MKAITELKFLCSSKIFDCEVYYCWNGISYIIEANQRKKGVSRILPVKLPFMFYSFVYMVL